MKLLAIFGPTGVGKTGVAIAVAERLRERGEDPVAVSCDAIQVYRGLETLSGAASAEERERLEHRLVGFVDARRASSAPGGSPPWPTRRSTSCSPRGGARSSSAAPASTCGRRWPTSTCARRSRRRSAPRSSARSPSAGPRRSTPSSTRELAATVHPNDRKRIARLTELQRAGIEPPPRERAGCGRRSCATRLCSSA